MDSLLKDQRSFLEANRLPSTPQSLKVFRKPFAGKRLFDIVFSLSTLILLGPLFLILWLGVSLSSRGGAFYSQLRVGKDGCVFKCFKFRTMIPDAEEKLLSLLASSPHLKKEWLETQKLKKDPRIFPFGKFLRKTSLDELPQFWNVLIGDLSVVGPRPYMISQKEELGHFKEKILSVRPGITGLWQTSGRSTTTFKQRIQLDAAYIDQQSLLFDLKLIFKTLPALLLPNDAY